jgi:serine protease Do
MASPKRSGLDVARVVVKAIALGVGFVATLLGLMALVGRFTPNGWARFGISFVLSVVIPAVITDRILPDDDPAKAKGLPGDVFALVWLGFSAAFLVGLGHFSRPLLAREGERLAASGLGAPAKLAYFLAGYHARTVSTPAPSASASAAPSGKADAPRAEPIPSDAGATSPDAAADASVAKKKDDKDELTAAELFKKLSPAVVTVSMKVQGMQGGGTGFLLDREGTIVTNHHVVSQAEQLSIRFANGASYDEVELLDDDAADDLALLRVPLKRPSDGEVPKAEPVVLGDSDAVQVGEHVIAIGNPLGLEHTLTDGLVSQRRLYEGRHWIQMSAPISPGNSGGPLFDMHGQVIGVTTATMGSLFAQNLNLAVPINALRPLIKSEYPVRHKIGKGAKSSTW